MDDESKTDEPSNTDNDDREAEPTETDADTGGADSDVEDVAPNDDDAGEAEPADKPKPRRKKKRKSSKKKAGQRASAARDASSGSGDGDSSSGNGMIMAVVALAAGIAIGWFGHSEQGTPGSASADPASVAPAGSAAASGAAAACKKWADDVCTGTGAKTEGCQQARAASEILPAKACQGALSEVATTVAKLKAVRSSCDTLVDKLCKDIGEETQSCALVRNKTKAFPPAQCKKMMENYGEVLGQLQKMEKKNAPLSEADAKAQAAGDPPSFGPADAKVTVVEYSDFECPYCSRAANALTELKARYGSVVRFVFRQFPLSFHKNAFLAAEASLAANAQGKFWPYHDILFKNAKQLDRASLEKYAKEVGLDMAKFKKDLDEHTYKAAVDADMKLGAAIGVTGTPTMIVGRKRAANPTAAAPVAAMIDAELTAAGVPIPKAP